MPTAGDKPTEAIKPPATVDNARATPLPDGNEAVSEMNSKYISIWRTLMAPKNVADAFGRRIAKRYIAVQLTVANRSTEYQWLIQDASVNLEKLLLDLSGKVTNQPNKDCAENLTRLLNALKELGIVMPSATALPPVDFEYHDSTAGGTSAAVSSADLTVLRGVAEKGQALDPRNLTLRLLTGAGSIAAGLLWSYDFRSFVCSERRGLQRSVTHRLPSDVS